MSNIIQASVMCVFFSVLFILPPTVFSEEHGRARGESNHNISFVSKNLSVMEDIHVRGKKGLEDRFAKELAGIGHSVEIITGEEIKKSGLVDLVQALDAMVPGFFTITRAGRGSYTTPSLHGSDSILWLVDGVNINDRISGGAYPNTIPIHMVDRIEVLKGGESLFYGTEARAGVINIITKAVAVATSGELGISYGNKEYMDTYGHATGTLEGHGLMAFGSTETWDGYVACNDQAYEDALNPDKKKPTGYDRNMVGVKYRNAFDISGQGILNLQLQKQKGEFDYGYPTYRNAYANWEEELAVLKWDHDLTDHFSYHIKSNFHSWWSNATFERLDGTLWFDDELWGYDTYGANLMTSTRWGDGHELITGVDYQTYEGSADAWNPKVRDHDADSVGVFIHYKPYLPFSPHTKLGAGLRHENTGKTDATIWDVSMRTPLYGQTYFRGQTGTSFTLPTVTQLYGDNLSGTQVGNPNLDPEESFNVEVGIGGKWRYFQCEAGYFYRGVEDMIGTAMLADNTRTYKNLSGKTEIDGVEISGTIGPFSGASFIASATWISAEDKDTGEQIEFIPEFFAKTDLRYRYPTGRFGADLMVRYVGTIYERNLDPFDDIAYGEYYIADVSCYITFGNQKNHRVTFRAENIFDKTYETQYYRNNNIADDPFLYHYDGLPRSLIVGYLYTF